MANKKYIIRYTDTYNKQLVKILKYYKVKLKNKTVAENFYNLLVTKIQERAKNSLSYEKYFSKKTRKNVYYRIYVKRFIIFYVVQDNIIEIRRILHTTIDWNKIL